MANACIFYKVFSSSPQLYNYSALYASFPKRDPRPLLHEAAQSNTSLQEFTYSN